MDDKDDISAASFFPFTSLPVEMQELVLSFLPVDDLLLRCRLVCRHWNSLLTSAIFWQEHPSQRALPADVRPCLLAKRHLTWQVWASMARRSPFGHNLLRNCCGELVKPAEFHHQRYRIEEDGLILPWPEYPAWKIMGSAGDGWMVHKEDDVEELEAADLITSGALFYDPKNVPFRHLRGFYEMSGYSCYKKQELSLSSEGVTRPLREQLNLSCQYRVHLKPVLREGSVPIFQVDINTSGKPSRARQHRLSSSSIKPDWTCYAMEAFELRESDRVLVVGHGGMRCRIKGAELVLVLRDERVENVGGEGNEEGMQKLNITADNP